MSDTDKDTHQAPQPDINKALEALNDPEVQERIRNALGFGPVIGGALFGKFESDFSAQSSLPFATFVPPPKRYTETMRIWITHQFVGFHLYPNPPEEVAYLGQRHRHIFHVKVGINVTHDEREIEYHMMKNWFSTLTANGEMDNKSCESMAREFLAKVKEKYPDRNHYSVEVNEDGECGSVIEHNQYYGLVNG